MSHIHTELGQHDHTVTLLVIRTDSDEPRLLLHMHRKHHRLLPIGGHIELLETPWQAAAHELTEESGYSLDELSILQPRMRLSALEGAVLHPYPVALDTHTAAPDHFHSDTVYAFVAHDDPKGSIGNGESADIRWVTRAQLDALHEPAIFLNAKILYTYTLDVCLKDWDQVDTASFAL
jgi:8-oxo-dGTP diphosphatase